MPNKHSRSEVEARRKAMDDFLTRFCLFVRVFAKEWGVSEKTVRRDMQHFKRLGRNIKMHFNWECSEHYFRYAPKK